MPDRLDLRKPRRRVYLKARELAEEALTNRHDEHFVRLVSRAIEAMILSVGGEPDTIKDVWQQAVRKGRQK